DTGSHNRPGYDTGSFTNATPRPPANDPLGGAPFGSPQTPAADTPAPLWSAGDTGSHQRPGPSSPAVPSTPAHGNSDFTPPQPYDTGSYTRGYDSGPYDTGSYTRNDQVPPAAPTGEYPSMRGTLPPAPGGPGYGEPPEPSPGYGGGYPVEGAGTGWQSPVTEPPAVPSTPAHGNSDFAPPQPYDTGSYTRGYDSGPYTRNDQVPPAAPTGEYPSMRGTLPPYDSAYPDMLGDYGQGQGGTPGQPSGGHQAGYGHDGPSGGWPSQQSGPHPGGRHQADDYDAGAYRYDDGPFR
ncbi:hypothetical protein SAMN02745673_03210, partial [Marinactinospora thermotolerans DSM 45154]